MANDSGTFGHLLYWAKWQSVAHYSANDVSSQYLEKVKEDLLISEFNQDKENIKSLLALQPYVCEIKNQFIKFMSNYLTIYRRMYFPSCHREGHFGCPEICPSVPLVLMKIGPSNSLKTNK